METKWQSEDFWLKALSAQRAWLRLLEQPEQRPRAAEAIARTKNRIERIRAAGRPEWLERDKDSRLP